jgi:hypothetical protein
MIVSISPAETPLVSTMPRTEVKHVRHDWLQDALAATATAGAVDGADFSSAVITGRTKVANITQIFSKGIKVSNSLRAEDLAGVDDEYKYQILKAIREKARDLERRIWSASGTCATGTSSVARTMKTMADFIKTNRFHVRATAIGHAGGAATASATSVTELGFNGLLARVFARGGNPEVVHTNAAGKRQVSQFNAGTSTRRNVAMADKTLYAAIDVYDSEFGPIEMILNRWVRQAANTATNNTSRIGEMYFIERAMVRLGVYRPLGHLPLAPIGDATRGIVIGEYTLEVGNEEACGRLLGVNSRFPQS